MRNIRFLKSLAILFVTGTLAPFFMRAQENYPDREERIYTLSTLWKELEYNFAFPEARKKSNPDSLYKAYLPKVENADNHYDYFRILSSFTARCNEAHTRIIAAKRPDDMPPLITTSIGRRVLVKNIARKTVAQIPVKSEILKVDDIPVTEYLRDSVYPYMGASTEHWKFDKSVIEMLYGRPGSEVKLTVKTPKGKIREVTMCRDYYAGGAAEAMAEQVSDDPVEIKILKGNIGYIHLLTCAGNKVKKIRETFYKHLPELLACKGLIVDMRGNRGGSDEAWEPLAFHLIPDKEFEIKGKWLSPKHISVYKMYGEHSAGLRKYYEGTAMEEVHYPPYKNTVPDSLRLNQPLVILSGQCVASAAEDFLLVMRSCGRGTIVGGPSVGCVGEPVFTDLPGGYSVMLCAKKYLAEDGTQPNDTGILPDIAVAMDYDAYMKGTDTQLERAIREVERHEAGTGRR